jgi:cyclopropane fatty-acyl-phospholipid synthase-like methyltransferase
MNIKRKIRLHRFTLLLLLPLLTSRVTAEAQTAVVEAPPPALETYKGRVIAQTMHWEGAEWLLRQEREREESTQLMMRNLGLKPGQTVCDLGSGNGYHTLMMARIVGESGRVLAVDIQQEMLTMLLDRAKSQGIHNVEPILGELHDPKLPENELDLVLAVDAYHEFSHPEHMLRAVRKSLKPTGQLALIEFRMEDPKVPIKRLHKMSKEQIMKELPPNGFKRVREFDELPWQHMMFFEPAPIPAGD